MENEIQDNTEQEVVLEKQTTQDNFPKSQEDIDKIVTSRLDRERKKWQKDFEAKLEEERTKSAMTESEKYKAEKEEAIRASQATLQNANKRVLLSEARITANTAGVKSDRLSAVLKLAEDDLASVEFDNRGEPNNSAIKLAIENVLKSYPEFINNVEKQSKAGQEFSGSNTVDPYSMDTTQFMEYKRAERAKQNK